MITKDDAVLSIWRVVILSLLVLSGRAIHSGSYFVPREIWRDVNKKVEKSFRGGQLTAEYWSPAEVPSKLQQCPPSSIT